MKNYPDLYHLTPEQSRFLAKKNGMKISTAACAWKTEQSPSRRPKRY